MRLVSSCLVASRLRSLLIAATLCAAVPLGAQQDPFRWMDFHSPRDQDIIVWVARTLAAEKWTAIREIGVQYDAALVVTTTRPSPQAAANADTFTVWSVSLTSHAATRLISGVNLRWLDFMRFADGAGQEPAALYDNCQECAAQTFFTAFHYDLRNHMWGARWLSGGQAVPVWSANTPPGVVWTQAYAGLAEPDGRQFVATWTHFDYGPQKPAEDFVYRYDLNDRNGMERTQVVSGSEAEALKRRICRPQDTLPGLARGQDSPLCEAFNPRPDRRPVTTPPANNHGRSTPPGGRRAY